MFKFLVAPALALGLAAFAVQPVTAQQSMSGSTSCTSDALHAAAMKISSQMSSMKMSGNNDKDYADVMMAMTKGAHDLSMWETKCGKNANMMKWAKTQATDFSTLTDQITNVLPSLGGGA